MINYRQALRSLVLVAVLSAPRFTSSSAYQQASVAPAEDLTGIVPPGSYKLDWKRHFQMDIDSGGGFGTADQSSALWLMIDPAHGFFVKITESGQLNDRYYPEIPPGAAGSWDHFSLASSGNSVGLLANFSSGGAKSIVFEGAYFWRVRPDGGLDTPKRIAGRGPQFTTFVGAGSGRFIVGGDQKPLTVLEIDDLGTVIWRRSLSPNLVLPEIAVGANNRAFVLSQGGAELVLQVFDGVGRVPMAQRITARQGTVAADASGGCTLLVSKDFHGENNRVYLVSFDEALRQLRETETPLRGLGGRTYQIVATPTGHLVAGEGAGQQEQVIADFDNSGQLRWQRSIRSDRESMIVPFPTGFYIVRHEIRKGMDIERYRF